MNWQCHCWSPQRGGRLHQSCTASQSVRVSWAMCSILEDASGSRVSIALPLSCLPSRYRFEELPCSGVCHRVCRWNANVMESRLPGWPFLRRGISLKLMWQERRNFAVSCQLSSLDLDCVRQLLLCSRTCQGYGEARDTIFSTVCPAQGLCWTGILALFHFKYEPAIFNFHLVSHCKG